MVSHDPSFETILMVEKALIDSDIYPTKTQLWKSLPKQVHYSTFKKVLDYLEASNKIEYNNKSILFLGQTKKLKEYIDTIIELK
ncbi:hypothetical protein FJY84_05105 [Candidatus Bathyarchaeota archaeon]|nr:hypothetical protein [Candidatus Bathyarchaeota archaeon]